MPAELTIIRRIRRDSLADADRLKARALALLEVGNIEAAKTTALDCLIMLQDAERKTAMLRERS